MKTAVLAVAIAGLVLCGAAWAGDIVTVPTANQLGPGQVDLAQYYISFDYPPGAPTRALFSTMYVGITDNLEIDVWHINPNNAGSETVLNATWLLTSERKGGYADAVVGVRDVGRNLREVIPGDFDRGVFVAAARTLNPPGGPPTAANTPIWRVHLGVGNELGLATDLSSLAESGLFGGIQALLTPTIGAIALWDGTDHVVGVTVTPDPMGPTFKGGVFGDHWWVGVNYTFSK